MTSWCRFGWWARKHSIGAPVGHIHALYHQLQPMERRTNTDDNAKKKGPVLPRTTTIDCAAEAVVVDQPRSRVISNTIQRLIVATARLGTRVSLLCAPSPCIATRYLLQQPTADGNNNNNNNHKDLHHDDVSAAHARYPPPTRSLH